MSCWRCVAKECVFHEKGQGHRIVRHPKHRADAFVHWKAGTVYQEVYIQQILSRVLHRNSRKEISCFCNLRVIIN